MNATNFLNLFKPKYPPRTTDLTSGRIVYLSESETDSNLHLDQYILLQKSENGDLSPATRDSFQYPETVWFEKLDDRFILWEDSNEDRCVQEDELKSFSALKQDAVEIKNSKEKGSDWRYEMVDCWLGASTYKDHKGDTNHHLHFGSYWDGKKGEFADESVFHGLLPGGFMEPSANSADWNCLIGGTDRPYCELAYRDLRNGEHPYSVEVAKAFKDREAGRG